MASSPELISPETEVTFARNLGLFDATMIGIGAGIFVLTGIAAGEAGLLLPCTNCIRPLKRLTSPDAGDAIFPMYPVAPTWSCFSRWTGCRSFSACS